VTILIAAVVVLAQVATGSILILLLPAKRKRSVYEILGLGLALGTFISMLSAVLLVNSSLKSFAWVIPTAIVVLVASFRSNILRIRSRGLTLPRNQSVAFAVGLAVGFTLLVTNWIRIPLSAIRAGGSVDMYFFEALSRGVSDFGPTQSILMTGGQLRYHWFSYAWSGELSSVADLDSFVALTRILPVVALIGVVLLAASWAGSIQIGKGESPWWVPSLAVILLVFAGYTGALYGIALNFDSPSQAFTTIWLLALVIVFIQGLKEKSTRILLFNGVFVAVLTVATTGGKASHAIVALGGFGSLALMGVLFQLTWRRNALVLFTFALFGFAIAYLWVLAGVGIGENLAESISVRASTWQGLDPVAGKWGPLLGTIALFFAVIARLSGVAWLARNRTGRMSPEFLFSFGALAVGVAALFALRGGINELWFFLAASAPLAVISAYGVGQAQNWLKPHMRKSLAYSLIAAIVASAASLLLSRNYKFVDSPVDFFLWPGVLYWLSVIGVWILVMLVSWFAASRVKFDKHAKKIGAAAAIAISALVFTSIFTRPAVLWTQSRELTTEIGIVAPNRDLVTPSGSTETSEQVDSLLANQFAAAQWLEINTSSTQLVATSNPDSSFIPAFTGNQMYLAGERYQRGLGSTGETLEIDRRLALSTSLLTNNLTASVQELCKEQVSFLWIEGSAPFIASLSKVSQNFGDVTIVDLTGAC